MKTLITYRWRIILGLIILLHFSLGIIFYISQIQAQSVLHICPLTSVPEEPNSALCKPAYLQTQIDIFQILFTIILIPFFIGVFTGFFIYLIPLLGLFIFDKLLHAKKRKLAFASLAGILSIFLLYLSLSIPVAIQNPEQFSNVKFGFPVSFIVQNQYYTPEKFPYITRFSSLHETPTRILWPEFITSFMLVTCILYLLLKGTVSIFTKRSGRMS